MQKKVLTVVHVQIAIEKTNAFRMQKFRIKYKDKCNMYVVNAGLPRFALLILVWNFPIS